MLLTSDLSTSVLHSFVYRLVFTQNFILIERCITVSSQSRDQVTSSYRSGVSLVPCKMLDISYLDHMQAFWLVDHGSEL